MCWNLDEEKMSRAADVLDSKKRRKSVRHTEHGNDNFFTVPVLAELGCPGKRHKMNLLYTPTFSQHNRSVPIKTKQLSARCNQKMKI